MEKGKIFQIPNLLCGECPVSYVTPESQELLFLYLRAFQMKEATGLPMMGPDVLSWPARLVDAFVVLYSETRKVENQMLTSITGGQRS